MGRYPGSSWKTDAAKGVVNTLRLVGFLSPDGSKFIDNQGIERIISEHADPVFDRQAETFQEQLAERDSAIKVLEQQRDEGTRRIMNQAETVRRLQRELDQAKNQSEIASNSAIQHYRYLIETENLADARLDLIRKIEWCGGDHEDSCPWCGFSHPTHEANCPINRLLHGDGKVELDIDDPIVQQGGAVVPELVVPEKLAWLPCRVSDEACRALAESCGEISVTPDYVYSEE